ncbi:MAG: hypothetical protein Fur0021_05570 [Candidatus Promineifilaceae bacterium]
MKGDGMNNLDWVTAYALFVGRLELEVVGGLLAPEPDHYLFSIPQMPGCPGCFVNNKKAANNTIKVPAQAQNPCKMGFT